MKRNKTRQVITDKSGLDALKRFLKKQVLEAEQQIVLLRQSIIRNEELINGIERDKKYEVEFESNIK